jgi:hypothetical protein
MAIYTVSPDLLRNIEKDEGVYFSDILFVFTNRANIFKVSKDKKGDIINCYQSIKENGDTIKTWLDLMSFKPSPFEVIDVDISGIECEETKFLKLCKETQNQNKFILYSTQNIKKYSCNNNTVNFENKAIQILDRDQARQELTPIQKGGDTFINSQVAQHGSQINESENK